jgi:probable F420-dependent oxidoreductase
MLLILHLTLSSIQIPGMSNLCYFVATAPKVRFSADIDRSCLLTAVRAWSRRDNRSPHRSGLQPATRSGRHSGEKVTFSGRHYRITGHAIAPVPVQKPHPPILIGGNGPRLLALAAREADIVGFSGITFKSGGAAAPDLSGWRLSNVDERVRHIREIAGKERYARLELNALVQQVVVTDDRHRAAAELTKRWPQLSVADILQSPYVLIGTVDQMVEDLTARRERWDISYYVVHEPYLDDFAPVVARLAGK